MKKLFITFSFWFLIFNFATAANDEILATLILDTKNQNINTLAGEIIIPESLKPLKILDGNSLINFWIETPRFEKDRLIFSGIIPGGYNGASGQLLQFILQGEQAQLANLRIRNLTALLNDGQGTKATAQITWQAGSLQAEMVDNIPPEPFTVLVSRASDLFDNQWFAAFATQDKQSGIDHYEIAESRALFRRLGGLNWVKTASPYQLTDVTGRSNVFVRAIDRAGNECLAEIIRSPWYQSIWLWIIIILFLCGGLFGLKKIFFR